MPDDLHLYVRKITDIPFTMKDEILDILEEKGWNDEKISIPDPTLLERMIRRRT